MGNAYFVVVNFYENENRFEPSESRCLLYEDRLHALTAINEFLEPYRQFPETYEILFNPKYLDVAYLDIKNPDGSTPSYEFELYEGAFRMDFLI